MGPYGLKRKETELLLRLYLERFDVKPIYWHWSDNNKIEVLHNNKWRVIRLLDLLNFIMEDPYLSLLKV